MKKIIFLILIIWIGYTAIFAQSSENNVPIAVYIPSSIEQPAVRNLLENRLGLIVSQNGMSDDQYNPRFIIYPTISVLTEERTTTPPVLTVVELQVNFFIADFVDNKKFASTSFTVKGGGQSEERAFLDAVKKIRNNSEIEKCLASGKQKIIEYYNQVCDKVIIQANELINQNQFYESILLLNSIPMSSDCFEKAQTTITQSYERFTQQNCERNLSEAEKYYAAQNIRKSLEMIALIGNECGCRQQANNLYNNILSDIHAKEEEAKAERDKEKALALDRELRDYNLILKSMDYAYKGAQLERENQRYEKENDYYKQVLKELFFEVNKMQKSNQSSPYDNRREQCITIIK